MHEVECTCFNVPALEKTKDKKKDEGRRGGEREETKEKPTASWEPFTKFSVVFAWAMVIGVYGCRWTSTNPAFRTRSQLSSKKEMVVHIHIIELRLVMRYILARQNLWQLNAIGRLAGLFSILTKSWLHKGEGEGGHGNSLISLFVLTVASLSRLGPLPVGSCNCFLFIRKRIETKKRSRSTFSCLFFLPFFRFLVLFPWLFPLHSLPSLFSLFLCYEAKTFTQARNRKGKVRAIQGRFPCWFWNVKLKKVLLCPFLCLKTQ